MKIVELPCTYERDQYHQFPVSSVTQYSRHSLIYPKYCILQPIKCSD